MYGGTRDYDEKRNYFRMQLNCSMHYAAIDEKNLHQGRCVNLSTRGMLIETDKYFPIGTRLKVNVTPSLDLSPPLMAIFEVRRAETMEEGGSYRFGGTFESVEAFA